MLKHQEYEEQYERVEVPAEDSPQPEIMEETSASLTSRQRMQDYIDKQQRDGQQQEYAEKLMATVQTEARKFRKNQAVTRGVAIVFGILMGLMLLLFVMHGLLRGKWDWHMLTSLTSMTGVVGMAAASSKTLKAAAGELSAIEDLRAVGPLAESLQIEEKTVRAQVENALIRLLPRLQASDAGLLNAEQRACLNQSLQGKNEELIVAILRAYEQVGDEAALPYVAALALTAENAPDVAQIARKTGLSRYVPLESKANAFVSAPVVEAAQACLPYLRARVERQRASQTLLRGASANDVAPNTLLRAAQSSEVTHPEQLLRPAGDT